MSTVDLPNNVSNRPQKETYPHTPEQTTFLRRALIVVGIVTLAVVLLWLLWQALEVVLLVFAGILLAVFLRALTNGLKRITHLPDKVSLGVVLLVLLAITAGAIWFMGPRIASQFSQLGQNLSDAADQFRQMISEYDWGQQLLRWLPSSDQLINQAQQGITRGGIFSNVTGVASRTAEIFTAAFVILFTGIFFAVDPGLYMKGIVTLFPHDKRERVWEILRATEYRLRWWLIGTLISMAIAGVLSGTTLWLLGVPLAFTLGVLMGLLEFVPYLGPLLATVPAVLLAFTVSPQTALWVLLIYEAIQILEGNVILPIVLQKSAEIPPVVTIMSQVLLGIVAGGLGILVATPLAGVVLLLIQMVYIHDILGDTMNAEKTTN